MHTKLANLTFPSSFSHPVLVPYRGYSVFPFKIKNMHANSKSKEYIHKATIHIRSIGT